MGCKNISLIKLVQAHTITESVFGCLEVTKVRKKNRINFQKLKIEDTIIPILLVLISYFLKEGRYGNKITIYILGETKRGKDSG